MTQGNFPVSNFIYNTLIYSCQSSYKVKVPVITYLLPHFHPLSRGDCYMQFCCFVFSNLVCNLKGEKLFSQFYQEMCKSKILFFNTLKTGITHMCDLSIISSFTSSYTFQLSLSCASLSYPFFLLCFFLLVQRSANCGL